MDEDVTSGGAEPPALPLVLVPAIHRRFFTRRRFLGMAGASTVGSGLLWQGDLAFAAQYTNFARTMRARVLSGMNQALENIAANPAVPNSKPVRTLTLNVNRREDMLRLRFEFYNLIASSADPNKLVKKQSNLAAYVVVTFPPQHLAEEALLRVEGQPAQTEPAPKPGEGGLNERFGGDKLARARLAGDSRLVFEVPNSALPLPRSQDGLLDWLKWTPRLGPGALPLFALGGPDMKQPALNSSNDPGETSLELPWRLELSPLPNAAWAHSSGLAATATGAYEMWHTRLAVKQSLTIGSVTVAFADERLSRHVRALWSKDPSFSPKNTAPPADVYDDDDTVAKINKAPIGDSDADGQVFEPFRTSLSPRNRIQIVQNTSGYKLPTGSVKPVNVNRLMLSPLGGFLDVEGQWDAPKSLDLLLWRHRATLGRDAYVEVIERGYFLPWGFPAVRIKITERVTENRDFNQAPGGKVNVAFLRQRIHFVILDPTLSFPMKGHLPAADARNLPFRTLEAKTVITPDVGEDVNLFPGSLVPTLGTTPEAAFRFDFEATDWEGRTIAFRQPMGFVYASRSTPAGGSLLESAIRVASFTALPNTHVLRRVPLNGQKIAYAKPSSPGDTTYESSWLTVRLELPAGTVDKHQAYFVPVMDTANVRLEAADAISGESQGGVDVAYPAHYVEKGFDATNKASTFMHLVTAKKLDLKRSDSAGGIASPSLQFTALSRAKGAIGGTPASHKANTFNPAEWFPADLLSAKMIGLDLLDIILNGQLDKSMTIQNFSEPDGVRTKFDWTPELKQDPAQVLIPSLKGKKGTFVLNSVVVRKNNGASTHDVRGELQNVKLQLLGTDLHFLDIELKRLIFTSRTGTSPHLDVKLGELTFVGPLTFVNELRTLLANKDGPIGVEVKGDGIEARANLSLPAVTVGIFSLKNLALNAKIGVPFDGRATYADFRISSKKDPFLVAVSIFGGGGWFGMRLDTTGLLELEAGFEFGGTVSLDFGVAGGSIEVMAGIYFRMEKLPDGGGNKVALTGYVRFRGEVHVGFVSVALVAEVNLTYVSKPVAGGKSLSIVSGRAQVTLEIPVAPDVSFEIEKSFGGDPHDPRFVDQIEPGEWLDYVDAFAVERTSEGGLGGND